MRLTFKSVYFESSRLFYNVDGPPPLGWRLQRIDWGLLRRNSASTRPSQWRLQRKILPGSPACWHALQIADFPNPTILWAEYFKQSPCSLSLSSYVHTYTSCWFYFSGNLWVIQQSKGLETTREHGFFRALRKSHCGRVKGRGYELRVETEAGSRTIRQTAWTIFVSAVESHLMILIQLEWRRFTLKSGDLHSNMDKEYVILN